MAPESEKKMTEEFSIGEDIVQNGAPEKSSFLSEQMRDEGQTHPGMPEQEKQLVNGPTLHADLPPTKRWHISITSLLFVTFFFHGIVVAILGPTLLELEAYTGSSTKQMSTVFTWRYLGTLLGVISAGFMYDKFHPHLLMGVALIVVCVLLNGAVWCTHLGLMCGTFFAQGYAAGTVSVGTNVVCLGLWGKKSGPYLQFLHLSATVGAALAPQIAKPFLTSTRTPNQPVICEANNTECFGFPQGVNSTQESGWNFTEGYTVSGSSAGGAMRFQYAYLIAGCLQLLISVMHLAVFCYSGCLARRVSPAAETCTRKQNAPAIQKPLQIRYMALFVLLCAFNGAMEDMAGGLLVTFVVKYLGMDESHGTDAVTLLFGCVSGGRAIAVLVSKCMRPSYMLSINMTVLVTSSAFLLLTTPDHHLPLWLCTAGIGLGLSSSFPCAIYWASTIIQASGTSTSAFFSGLFIGKMVGPPILGYMFDELSPRWFIYSLLIGSLGMAVVYILICIVCLCHKRTHVNSQKSTELPSLHIDSINADI